MSEAEIGIDSIGIKTIDSVDLNLPLAGLGSRAYAYLIDWHIKVIAAFAVGLLILVACIYFEVDKQAMTLWIGLPTMAIYVFYQLVAEMLMGGSSPGKKQAKLRVVTLAGDAPSMGAILSRNLFRLVDGLPLFYLLGVMMMMFTAQQVRIGDLASGTRVIHDRRGGAVKLDALLANPNISPQQATLIAELLERWSDMAKPRRSELARTLLARVGAPAADHLSDRQLWMALKKISEGRNS